MRDRDIPSRSRVQRIFSLPPRPEPSDPPYVRRLWRDVLGEEILPQQTQAQAQALPPRPQRRRRHVLNPCSILDVTGVSDDERMNLMDWRDDRDLAVAIRDHLVLVKSSSSSHSVQSSALLSVDFDKGPITSVSWDPRRSGSVRLAIGLYGGQVQLWDLSSSARLLRTFRSGYPICSLSWNGDVLTAGRMDGLITGFDITARSHRPVVKYRGHQEEVCGLRWSSLRCSTGARTLASGGLDGKVHIWDIRSSRPCSTLDHGPDRSMVKALAWSPVHDDVLACGAQEIKVWNFKTNKILNSAPVVGSRIFGLAWSPDGEELLSCAGNLAIWEYPWMHGAKEYNGSGSAIVSVSQSRAGVRLATLIGREEELVLWDVFGSDRLPKISTPFANNYRCIIRFQRYWFLYEVDLPRLDAAVDQFKMALDFFFAICFVVHNVWVFGQHSSFSDAPNLYRPLVLCVTICCCFPCVISFLVSQEDPVQYRGARSELIEALPTYKLKSKRSRGKGSDTG